MCRNGFLGNQPQNWLCVNFDVRCDQRGIGNNHKTTNERQHKQFGSYLNDLPRRRAEGVTAERTKRIPSTRDGVTGAATKVASFQPWGVAGADRAGVARQRKGLRVEKRALWSGWTGSVNQGAGRGGGGHLWEDLIKLLKLKIVSRQLSRKPWKHIWGLPSWAYDTLFAQMQIAAENHWTGNELKKGWMADCWIKIIKKSVWQGDIHFISERMLLWTAVEVRLGIQLVCVLIARPYWELLNSMRWNSRPIPTRTLFLTLTTTLSKESPNVLFTSHNSPRK